MLRFVRFGLMGTALCGLFLCGTTGASGQGAGAIIGTGTFTSFVENMDRSLAFYHDLFDMDVPAVPESGERPYNRANPQLFAMFDIAGARERHQSARVAGTRLSIEMMEIQQVDHRTIPLRVQDPGAATLVLVVRDIDAALARIKAAKASVVTPGEKPVTLADGTRALLIRDIDDRFIEIRQPASPPDASATTTNNIVDLRLSIAVNDMDRTKHVYRDVLGFKVEGETAFAADAPTRSLTGLRKAEVRRSRVQAPGSPLWIELVEYKGVDRTPLRMGVNHGVHVLRAQLKSSGAAILDPLKSAGLTVVSQGGTAVPIPPNLKGALVADPNNFFLTPFAPCDGCAARLP
jgi:catechol 2,3-dioxygenase-like lactoylglutathione lyase family enzyme